MQSIFRGKAIAGENDATFNTFLAERTKRNEEGDIVSVTLDDDSTIFVGDEVLYGLNPEKMTVTSFIILQHLVGGAENPPRLHVRLKSATEEGYIQGPLSLVEVSEQTS